MLTRKFMYKKNLLFTIPIFFTTALLNHSLANDTLLYRSVFEEKVISKALQRKDVDYLTLYASIFSDSAACSRYKSLLNAFYSDFDNKIVGLKSNKQKAKLIFKEVHDRFFRQYEENVLFTKIFEDGIYNCVTSSMLYSIVLEHYNIPFEIKEKPTHVYLVAFPGTDNILFETTNPKGFFVPDEKSKREFVEGLIALKFTTQEHVNTVGVTKAFNEFYYNNLNIDPLQLAGVQYYNQALSLYEQDSIHEAIKSARKMYMLYPSPKNLYLKTSLISVALGNSTFDTARDILYLCEYANSTKDIQDKRKVLNTFDQIIDDKLFKNGNDSLVTDIYKAISRQIDDKELAKDISFLYYAQMASWQQMKGNMDESLDFAERAFAINDKDVRLHDVIVRGIVLKTQKLKGDQKNIDILNNYTKTFPFLKSHKTFKALLVYQYSLLAYSLFLQNSGKEAYDNLALLESELTALNEKTMISEEMIGMVYAEAGAYHYRRKEYKKAKEIILKGLEIAPDHGELKERLRIVEDEL